MSDRRMVRLRAAAAASIFIMASGGAVAQAVSIEGLWTGSGYAEVTSGKRERVSCRVRYSRETPDVFGVSAVCASPSVNLSQTGTVSRVAANRFVGDLYNPEFDVSGRVRVVVSGATQTVTLSSARGSGSLSLSRK